MRALDEIEPRIPLVPGATGVVFSVDGSITINASGSYILTKNLTVITGNAISVQADGVAIDLMGFTIRSNSNAANGAAVSIDADDVAVRGGQIRSGTSFDGGSFIFGPGFQYGIHVVGTRRGTDVRDLIVHGTSSGGIVLDPNGDSLVDSCIVRHTGGTGISASLVRASQVEFAGAVGILADTVEQSRARSTAFNAINAKSVNLSFGESLSNNQFHRGIVADMVTNSRGTSAGGHGISADTVMNSHGISSGEHGFDSCGIHGVTVIGSTGLATDMAGANQGIRGDRMVQSSFGESKSTHMGANGIHATSGMVESSDGRANGGSGIYAPHVNSSRGGVSNDGLNGIDATVVVDSVGTGTPLINQYGIRADRANSSEASGGEDIGTKYNMP